MDIAVRFAGAGTREEAAIRRPVHCHGLVGESPGISEGPLLLCGSPRRGSSGPA